MPSHFKIGVLISGGGTTLRNLLEVQRRGLLDPEIACVVSSNPNAAGLEFAREAGIAHHTFSHRELADPELSQAIFQVCRERQVDLVVCGGFLRKLQIPADFQNRVINIHPSLIPAFCGKGFYGQKVHQGVLDYGARVTGCTVHFVDDQFDHGPIIAQRTVAVHDDDTAQSLAARVFAVECELYPQVINWLAAGRIQVAGRQVTILPESNSAN